MAQKYQGRRQFVRKFHTMKPISGVSDRHFCSKQSLPHNGISHSTMYTPPHFEVNELPEIHAAIRACGLAHFVTATAEGIFATPLPFFLVPSEGEYGTLYG